MVWMRKHENASFENCMVGSEVIFCQNRFFIHPGRVVAAQVEGKGKVFGKPLKGGVNGKIHLLCYRPNDGNQPPRLYGTENVVSVSWPLCVLIRKQTLS
jgi:hypothetical protein